MAFTYIRVTSLLLIASIGLSAADECEFIESSVTAAKIGFQLQLSDGRHIRGTYLASPAIDTPSQIVQGELIQPMNDSRGCDETAYLTETSAMLETNRTWIALVERGVCHFYVKEAVAGYLGAAGLIVYQDRTDDTLHMKELSNQIPAVMISQEEGRKLSDALSQGILVKAAIYTNTSSFAATTAPDTGTDSVVLLAFTGLMSPTAIFLNVMALFALIYYPEKPKPYLYLIANLVIADLCVAVIGTTLILFLHRKYPMTQVSVDDLCIAVILTDFWDSCILSHLLTLLSLTMEHFIAFRWPLKHKFLVTKTRVTIVIVISWLIALLPTIIAWIRDVTSVPACVAKQGLCPIIAYKYSQTNNGNPKSWIPSVIWVLFPLTTFLVMASVYGYITWIINRVSTRNPGFRKKRYAVMTTLFLIVSFLVSYAFFIVQHINMFVQQDAENHLLSSAKALFGKICASCELMLDFLFTGMIGAIMDPIIYCARMKEIKYALDRICLGSKFMRRPSVTSTNNTGGYMKAPQHSTHSEVEEEPL